MKKPFITFRLLFCLIIFNNLSFSQSVSLSKAKEISLNHLLTIGKNNLKSATLKKENIHFKAAKMAIENRDTLYFILNDTINNTFVIVSADERVWPILGYSTEGTYDEKKQPDAFVSWMDARKKEIAYIKANNLDADKQTTEQWNQLKSATLVSQSNGVEPLLKTKWNQWPYYNDLCPVVNGVRTPTGCVATALAQIMKYWNYPTHGIGSHSYQRPNPVYGAISADFGSTTYQWAQMPNELTGPNDAVATLMYHIGVASDMWYCSGGSSPSSDEVLAIQKYFDYSSSAERISSDEYTTSDWANILRSELDHARPVYYTKVADPGHAFVCDGYQESDYFHFNWGWGGGADGYYYIGNLNPYGNNFTGGGALIKITPNRLPDGYQGIFLSNNSIALGSDEGYSPSINVAVVSSAKWTASSDQAWLSISAGNGEAGTSTLTLTSSENNTNSTRTAKVSITAEGFPKQTITIKQYHYIETTAGNLQNVISNDLATSSILILKGSIDARDFKTMRDVMPLLSKLNLSHVTINEYTGTGGTSGNNSTVYPANTIPDFALKQKIILKSVKLPNSLTAVGKGAFNDCRGINAILLPSGVTTIGMEAFYNCRQLANVIFSNSLTSIGSSAFFWCDHLYPGTIPLTVKFIGSSAFANIKGPISVDPNNPNYSSAEGVLYNKNKTSLMQCPTSIAGSFIVPPTVNTIESAAFLGDIYLTAITLPSTLNSIGVVAFGSCGRLKKISLPFSIKQIGSFAFENCASVDTIISKSSIPINLANTPGVFNNLKKDIVILKVPVGSKASYQVADQWKDFINIVEMPNQAPTANAGADQSVNENSQVMLDGSASSDADAQTITYLWTAPVGVELSSPTAQKPTFTVAEVTSDKTLTFTLVVSDGTASSTSDQVIVTVKNVNKVPTANAGADQSVNENSLVTLDGSASSDADGQTISYLWTAPVGVILSSTTAQKPTFTVAEVTADKILTFTLVVSDGTASSTSDQVIVTVKNGNKVPVANAGADQSVNENSLVTLDGSASSDADGQTITYLWTAPAGITLSSTTSAKPVFKAPEVNVDTKFLFSLIVNDGISNSQADQVEITVKQVIKVGIDLLESPEFKIFPNPTAGITNIEVPEGKSQSVQMSIYNMQGKEIFSEYNFPDNCVIDFSPYDDGVYLLKIKTESKNYTAKIVLKR